MVVARRRRMIVCVVVVVVRVRRRSAARVLARHLVQQLHDETLAHLPNQGLPDERAHAARRALGAPDGAGPAVGSLHRRAHQRERLGGDAAGVVPLELLQSVQHRLPRHLDGLDDLLRLPLGDNLGVQPRAGGRVRVKRPRAPRAPSVGSRGIRGSSAGYGVSVGRDVVN